MSDAITTILGARPWQPDEQAELIVELDYYNVPTAGVLQDRDGGLHVFVLAAGAERDVQTWLFARIDEHEATLLAEIRGPEILKTIQFVMQNRWVRAALTLDHEIADYADLDSGEEPPRVLVKRYLAKLKRRIASTEDGVQIIEHEIGPDSAQGELAFA